MDYLQLLWCWRCKCEIPMLDDAEREQVHALLKEGIRAIRRGQLDRNSGLKPALDAYERLTGRRETKADRLWHHVISRYGRPCRNCGKVLRTPTSSKCFECGQPRRPWWRFWRTT